MYNGIAPQLGTSLRPVDLEKIISAAGVPISGSETNFLINYYIDEGYLKTNINEDVVLTAKGIDECERGFPNLDPFQEPSLDDITLIFSSTEESEILNKLRDIEQWREILDRLENQVCIIKSKLEKIVVDIEDEDLQGLVREAIRSNRLPHTLHIIYRILRHPDTPEIIKSALTDSDIQSLPPPLTQLE